MNGEAARRLADVTMPGHAFKVFSHNTQEPW